MKFSVERNTVVCSEGPPHFGKTYDVWSIKIGNLGRFDSPQKAEALVDRLNKAVDPVEITIDEVLTVRRIL